MKKTTLKISDLKKLISERALIMLEEELDDMPPVDKTPDSDEISDDDNNNFDDMEVDRGDNIDADVPEIEGYAHLGLAIEKLAERISDDVRIDLDSEVDKAIKTGRINSGLTFQKMVTEGKDKLPFDYYTSVLGAMYKQVNGAERDNIRKALFLSLPVYATSSYGTTEGDSRPSRFTALVLKKAGVGYMFHKRTSDSEYYKDIAIDAIYKSLDYCLKNYDASKGGTFSALVLFKAAGYTMDGLSSSLHKRSFEGGGKKQSLDEPFGDEENAETAGDRLTGKENEVSSSEKEAVKNFAGALKSFVTEKLSQKSSLKNYLQFFNLFAEGNSLAEIADIMQTTNGNVRVIKSRMEDFITKFVESGELQEYIKGKTGMNIQFPENKFTLSVQGTKQGEGEVAPVEYFNATGNDPETGDPVGEWVSISPSTHDSETSWFQGYADIAMRGDAETHVRDNGSSSEEEENIEEPEVSPITETLTKFIRNTLNKE